MTTIVSNIIAGRKEKLLPFIDQAVVSGGNFFVCILLARSLGLEIFGEFTLAWLVVLFASSIHQAWLITPMYTFAPQKTGDERSKYLDSLLVHQIVFSTAAALLSFCFVGSAAFFYPEWDLNGVKVWLPITVFAYLMYDFSRKLFYVEGIAKKSLMLDILVYSIQGSALIAASYFSFLSLKSTFIIVSISLVLPVLLFGRKMRFNFNRSVLLTTTKKHWEFAKWLIGTSLLQWISGNFFIIIAGGLISPLAVGAIRILQNIIGVLHVLFLAIENYVPIRAVQIFDRDGLKGLGNYLKGITLKGSILTLLTSICIAVFGKQIITLLYGSEHLEYAYLLYGFALLYVFVFIGTNLRFAIRTLELTRSIFLAYLLSAIFSLLFAKTIIQSFGIDGILLGLILTQIIMQAYFIYSLRSKLYVLWKSST
ncbi:MAG: hypothetical protein HKN92_08710 [Chitinophagales bacterium]|nr:hypothetical protein [Chitinophagales bacterium]